MRSTMKNALAALAFLALTPMAFGRTVYAPFPGTVRLHRDASGMPNAVDILSPDCGYWGATTAVVGTLYWNVTIRTTQMACSGSGSGTHNEAKHVWADGYTFRQWHFLKTANSYDRTCDRCQIGDIGATGSATSPHAHLQYDKSGTLSTDWISPNLVDGQYVSGQIGYLP